jgi:6-pyruvoyltetrahydropterin/6-carboxytetrahydropterin synthase
VSEALPHVRLTRRYRFSAAHRLRAAALDDAANRAVYGKCNNPFGHGHDYTLEVTVDGTVDPRTGRVAAPAALDALVAEKVLAPFDRADLNTAAPEFAALVPTTENLAKVIAARLSAAWRGTGRISKIRVHETRRNRFEVCL